MNAEKAKQLILFDGMSWGCASLTDIDFCLEYHNKVWVLGEAKYHGAKVPDGQRTLLTRFVNMAHDAGKRAIAIVVDHQVWDWKQGVQLRDCMVREYYTTEIGRWVYPNRPYYVGEMIDKYLEMSLGGTHDGKIGGCV